MSNSKYPTSSEDLENHDFNDLEDLIQSLNINHSVNLVDTDKYLLGILYSQMIHQIGQSKEQKSLEVISNQINKIFNSELQKINEDNQNRFETIMVNGGIKSQIIDILSKHVYRLLQIEGITE